LGSFYTWNFICDFIHFAGTNSNLLLSLHKNNLDPIRK